MMSFRRLLFLQEVSRIRFYVTSILVLFSAWLPIPVVSLQSPLIPKLCEMLFNISPRECPPPLFITKSLICFARNGTLLRNNDIKNLEISECQKWQRITFIHHEGQKCIQKVGPPDSPTNLTVHYISPGDTSSQFELPTDALHATEKGFPLHNSKINLHRICMEGKLNVVKYILSNSLADINGRDQTGRTPAMAAAIAGQVAVFKYLVMNDCDLTGIDAQKDNILHIGCRGGNVEIVRQLVDDEKYDLEVRGSFGRTPVLVAALFGNCDAFVFLMDKGCNVKAVDFNFRNILHLLCANVHIEMLEYVISLNIISIESGDRDQATPVMIAAQRGHRKVVEVLVRQGCDLTSVTKFHDNILHMACIGGNIGVVRYIVSLGVVNIDSRGYKMKTAVMTAVEYGHKAVVQFLVQIGCHLRVLDDMGNSILHIAGKAGNVNVARYLISLGVIDRNSRNYDHKTPFQVALENKHHLVAAIF